MYYEDEKIQLTMDNINIHIYPSHEVLLLNYLS